MVVKLRHFRSGQRPRPENQFIKHSLGGWNGWIRIHAHAQLAGDRRKADGQAIGNRPVDIKSPLAGNRLINQTEMHPADAEIRPAIKPGKTGTHNLDLHTADHVFAALTQLMRASGLATIIATHNMELASRMDRRVTLREGQVVELE